MKRLHYVNFFGVIALAVLCVMQWRHDRQLNLEINRLEKVRLDQAGRLAEQERNVRGLDADLTQFKELLTKAQQELNETRAGFQAAERHGRQLTAQRDQLAASVTNWAAAVAIRDERLEQANARIRELADGLNASIEKFNELATNYNAVVKDLNELRERSKPQPQ
jgi:chromosome segregation ATPase